jgi:hypothetical protein
MRQPGIMDSAVQWFRAQLPPLDPGAREDYRVEWSRGGRRMATLPADGSWYSLVGVAHQHAAAIGAAPHSVIDATAVTATSDSPVRGHAATGQPRFGYDLQFFAALTADLRAELIGAAGEGYRANFFIKGGRVVGPTIDAELLPEGADFMNVRPDGVGICDIKITWRTRDGAMILDQSSGVFDLGPNGYAKVATGDFTGSPPLLLTVRWSTGHPKWQWLNRCQGLAIGRVTMETLQVQADIYIPRVGGRIAGG